jgi:putative endonuclease
MERNYFVYIMSNKWDTVLYIGVTNDLLRRVSEHKAGAIKGFTQKYNVNKLVYFEDTTDINEAIGREKELKGWSRKKKNVLIDSVNPSREDLGQGWF